MLPAVRMLPACTLPVALTNPAVVMLPPIMLPFALIKPVTYSPLVAIVTTLLVPATVIPILPLVAAAIFEVPAEIGNPAVEAATPVN